MPVANNRILINQSSIIRNSNLLFWYDPNKRGSIVGNTVLDLSGRGLTATWINGTPSVVNNGWNITYPTNQYLNRILDTKSYGDFSISFWFKLYTGAFPLGGGLSCIPLQLYATSTVNKHLTFDLNDDDLGAAGVTMWAYWNGSGNPYSVVGKAAGGTPSEWCDDVWRHYTFTRSITNSPYTKHYMNGIEVTDYVTMGGSQTELFCESSIFDVNFYYGYLYNVQGLLGPVYAYDKELTAAEVLWNYNADKNRFT